MICFPNAKINIGLNITSKRSDGFHEIESIFYPIRNLQDALEIVENNENDNIEFTSSGILIPGNNADNLCVKAYHLIKQICDVPPIKIHLHKHIPIGAGMGGGSADAAFFIQLINSKFNINLSYQQMFDVAITLGSDCAFFLNNKPCFVTGRGEILQPINLDLSNYKIVIVHPNIHISTKEAYSGVVPKKSEKYLLNDIQKPVEEWKDFICNDFENSIFEKYPQLHNIKQQLYAQGASYASMSGSGSTMFGLFKKQFNLEHIIISNTHQVYELK
jgi:4-diphosphocytidyl-2-C-methyl-D-erythritol kinase